MYLRKILFFALFFAPIALYSAPGNITGTNCSIDASGVLTCYADAGESNTGDLKNDGATLLDASTLPNGLQSINLWVAGTTGNIYNISGGLQLVASGDGSINGAVDIKGSVYNSTEALGTSSGTIRLEGGTIAIGDGIMNLSGTAGAYDPSSATVFIDANDQISINGNIWNNTTDGNTAEILAGNAVGKITIVSANGISIGGNVISFGGGINLSNVAGKIDIYGDLVLGEDNDGNGGTSDIYANGGLEIGHGGLSEVNISAGVTTFNVTGVFGVLGDFVNDTGAGATDITSDAFVVGGDGFGNVTGGDLTNNSSSTLDIITDNLTVYGLISNTAGKMTIDADSVIKANNSILSGGVGGIENTSGGYLSIISGDGMELGTDGFSLSGRLDVGYTAVSSITAGNMEITDTANSNYVISSYGDIALGGSLLSAVDSLRIANGQTLEIVGLNDSTYSAVVLNSGGFGRLLNNGTLTIGDDTEDNKIRSFESGAITSQGVSALNMADLTIITGDESGYALNDITVGAINNNAYSNTLFYADDNLTVGIITNALNSGTLDLTSENGAFYALGLINNSTSDVIVSSGTSLDIDGNLSSNVGGKIALLSTGETTISGNITNTNASHIFIGSDWNDVNTDGIVDSGEILSLPVGALTIDGAFVNSAYFHGEVSGLTTINAVDTSAAIDFYLKTGTLDLDAVGYSSLLHNNIDQLYLELTSTTDNTDSDGIDTNDLDDINVAEIVNGSDGFTIYPDSNMYISAENVTVSGLVQNLGESMTIEANGGDISIGTLQNRTEDGVFANGGTGNFDILTTGSVTVGGNVSNFGTLTINGGAGVTLTNGLDNRNNMQVLTGASGKLSIGGNIHNYGVGTDYTVSCGMVSGSLSCTGRDLHIWANQLESTGSFNNDDGLALVYMNNDGGLVGTSHFDSISANGGRLDLGGNGTMLVQNDIDVASGAYMNVFGLSGLTSVDGAISITNDITSGQQYVDMSTSAGNLNVSSTTFTLDGADGISVGGNVILSESTGHTLTLKSDVGGTTIAIGGALQALNGNSSVGGNNTIILRGDTTASSLSQSQYGIIQTYGGTLAISGAASIAGGIDFGGSMLGYFGLEAMSATNTLAFSASSLTTSGIEVGLGNTLGVTTSGSITSSGAVRNDGILNLSANGYVIDAGITNNGTMTLTNTNTSALDLFDISNLSGDFTINNIGRAVSTGAITIDGGQVTVNSSSLTFGSITQNSGAILFNGTSMTAVTTGGGSGLIDLDDNLAIGTPTPMDPWGLNVSASGMTLASEDLNLDEDSIIHYSGSATFEVTNSLTANAFSSDAGAGTLTINAGVVPVIGTILKTDTFEILGDGLDETNTFVNFGTTNIYANNISIANGIVNDGELSIYAEYVAELGDINNSDTMSVSADNANSDLVFGDVINEGIMNINWWGTAGSDNAAVAINGLTNTVGTLALNGYELKADDDIEVRSIYQDDTNHADVGSVSVMSNDYTVTMAQDKSVTVVTDITGSAGNTLAFNTNILNVGGNIDSDGGTIIFSAADYLSDCLFGLCSDMPADPTYDIATGNWSPWMKANVTGDISGGIEFIGVGRMHVGGDYIFNDDSKLTIAVLPKDLDTTYAGADDDYTFYGKISETSSGVALDLTGAKPIVDVGGTFTLDLSTPSDFQTSELPNIVLQDGNVGLTLFDSVTEDTVVWLVKADNGVDNTGYFLPRNLAVYFCNADGTKCFNYMNSLDSSGDPTELPVYLRLDSSTGDPDNIDSIFAVFDTSYGGPLLMYNLETEVRNGSYDANIITGAGVLDDWLAKGIVDAGFLGENDASFCPFFNYHILGMHPV